MRSSETLPAEGIGYIPVTRGHREGFGDSGGVLRSLETLAAASGTLDCVPIDRPDICRCQVPLSIYS